MQRLTFVIKLLLLLIIFQSCGSEQEEKEIEFSLPTGFELEDLYSPSSSSQGSWVSITEGLNGTFYACDQYGDIFKFQMPAIGSTLDSLGVDSIDLNIGWAHGLLYAFESLYVVVVKDVDEDNPNDPTSGVFRLQDLNGDGEFDAQEKILDLDGQGEHGPHTLRVSPDGQSLYLIAGNFNTVPDHFRSRLPRTWGEDNLFPQYLDARGHANDLVAPGGWVAKTDPAGESWELVAAGFRNPFSMGFNQDGELFAYDADMEWDFGMPWYRPTRILHVTSGAEFGWRTGSGKWPVYYPDNLPAVQDMAQGSPTAVIMGKDLKFPKRYRNGLFACDWSFGTIYYVDLKPAGSSYEGSREEFLSGIPLPISNAIAGSDGRLYFLTGGRRLDSHMYRLRYVGEEAIENMTLTTNDVGKDMRDIRQSLEVHHSPNSKANLSEIWSYLDHDDRHIRYAARIALEHQPIRSWQNKIWTEKNKNRALESSLAYARAGGAFNQKIVNTLTSFNWEQLSNQERIFLSRIVALMFIRNEEPSQGLNESMSQYFGAHYPSNNDALNRELSQLMIKLKHPQSVVNTMALLDKTSTKIIDADKEVLSTDILDRSERYGPKIVEMLANMPPTEAIHYAMILSHATEGWTKELREQYFAWFENAFQKKGGNSYKVFLDNMRSKALNNVPEEDYDYFREKSGFYSPLKNLASIAQPIGPGRPYNHHDVGDIVMWGDDHIDEYDGTFADGQRAFEAALCSSCHRIHGEGGDSGPDLSNINTRFKRGEITDAIVSPNEAISDQYAFTRFVMKSNESISGRLLEETDDGYVIYQSPYDMTQTTELKKADVVKKSLSAISPMPAKLIDRLNEDEVKDLFIYLLTGADEEHEYYN